MIHFLASASNPFSAFEDLKDLEDKIDEANILCMDRGDLITENMEDSRRFLERLN